MAAQPEGWLLDLAGSATVERDATVLYSGLASLKYSNPDNATNGGWHGIQTRDPLLGTHCLPLRAGATYRIKVATRTSRIAGGQKFRLFIYHDLATTISQNKEFTYLAVNTWQVDEWTFTVPLNAEPNSTLFMQFNRNGDATATDFWVDSFRMVEQEVGTNGANNLANAGREDLVLNGDFESGLAWWGDLGNGGVSIETGADKYLGLKSIKLTGTSTWTKQAWQVDDVGDSTFGKSMFIRVFPGDKLRIRAACKLSAASGLTGQVLLDFYKHDFTFDSTGGGGGSLTWTTNTTWLEKEAVVNLSGTSSIYYIKVYLSGAGAATTGSVWFDEVHIWRMKRTEDLWDNAITSAKLAQTATIRQGDLGTTSGATTVAWDACLNYKITLNGNWTPTFNDALENGSVCVLKVKQDATGGRTITWPAKVHWEGGSAPAPTTTANKIAIYTFYYEGSIFYGVMSQGNNS